MKQLDWKSLAIGVLLTTTIVACVGAKNTTNEHEQKRKQTKLTNKQTEQTNRTNKQANKEENKQNRKK